MHTLFLGKFLTRSPKRSKQLSALSIISSLRIFSLSKPAAKRTVDFTVSSSCILKASPFFRIFAIINLKVFDPRSIPATNDSSIKLFLSWGKLFFMITFYNEKLRILFYKLILFFICHISVTLA